MNETPKNKTDNLIGQHAIVTGGGRGIGAAIVSMLADSGADVTLMGRDKETLTKHATSISLKGKQRVFCQTVDVTDPQSIERAFKTSQEQLGPAHILVNNAGGVISTPFLKLDLAQWNESIALNLTGVYLCTQHVVEGMIKRASGRIINISSTAGLSGYPYVSHYCAAKHGVVGFTKALALELSEHGITVNSVCPGMTDTDLIADSVKRISKKTGLDESDVRKQFISSNLIGRLIEPSEVASAVLWLCLAGQASQTGQTVMVDGGPPKTG